MTARRPVTLILLAASLGGFAGVAGAQEPDPNVTVVDRPRPDFDPLGIRAGGFLVLPSVTVSETYDDNILAEPDDEESDFITLIRPRVQATSDWVRHRLGVTVGSDIGIYADNDEENFEDYFAALDGRLDIRRGTTMDGVLDVGKFHEGREDVEDVEADEVTEYFRYGGRLALSQTFNRFNVRGTGVVAWYDYDDVAGINNDDRDRTDYDALLRLGYLVSPRVNVFTEGRYSIADRDAEVDDDGFDRDSDGWEGRLGTAVDITAVLFGEAFVGYRYESFDDEAFDSVDGLSFGVDLTWNPTGLTTLILSGGSDIEATNQTGASGNFKTEIALSVDHELLRNLLVGGFGGYQRDDFDGIDRVDETFTVGATVTYLLNRYLSLQGSYDFSDRSSDLDTEEFTRNRITLGLTAQL